ncbi:MAG: sugar phosphate isomerase/epimerase [Planctomycetes bacterium]|nr:sugar phosphate isomerase/epimerase [Planctomycetota bacterium]
MKLSFMTFVCPEWQIERAIEFAAETDYDGIEIRVDAGHAHGISSESTSEERQRVKNLFADAGVEVASVATSVHFACPETEKHQENLESARANLDLAADLGAPVVRIFAGGGIPELTGEAADRVAAAFDEVGEYSKSSGSCPMLECGHDIIEGPEEASKVIRRVTTDNFGVLWNHAEMDDRTFEALKSRIRHFHVHDDVLEPENTAVRDLAKRMKAADYTGFVSLEIIWGENLPEDLLRETGSRLKGFIEEA